MKHELKRLQIEKASIADDEHNETIKTMNTPKLKAQELVVKYLRIENINDWWSTVPAKQCALIAVDEVISVIDPETNYKAWEFWKQVKEEIEKL